MKLIKTVLVIACSRLPELVVLRVMKAVATCANVLMAPSGST